MTLFSAGSGFPYSAATLPQASPTSTDVIYQTPRRVGDNGGVTSSTVAAVTIFFKAALIDLKLVCVRSEHLIHIRKASRCILIADVETVKYVCESRHYKYPSMK